MVGQLLPHYGGGVNWRIVPVKHPALFSPMRPLLLQNLWESSEGIHIEGGIDRLPLLDHLGIDEPVGVKEVEDHLLHVARMHPCLNWAWLSLFDTLIAHSFFLRSVEGHHGFVHCKKPGEKSHTLAANRSGEVAAGPDPLFLLNLRQKFGDPIADFFTRPSSL